jgi:hypothetical protein
MTLLSPPLAFIMAWDINVGIHDRIGYELGADRYHSFRRFAHIVNQARGCKEYQEIKKVVAMTILGDYFVYLK